MKNTHQMWEIVDAKKEAFETLANDVWGTPETCYMEEASADAHERELRAQGFKVTRGVANIPTSMVAEAGEGGPVIAILGEFDALPGLSQEAGVTTYSPLVAGGNGHGCGHNLLGAGAMLAATAVKQWLEENNIAGRVRYYGCPAEEGGAAKAFMVKEGLFDDVDIALSWHPGVIAEVMRRSYLANTRVDFTFTGVAAHAAGAPHLGRSALDAVELMSVGSNYLREHMTDDARLHYAYLDAGGIAPNVVQARAKVRYSVRASTVGDMLELLERVKDVAQGAALMTSTKVEIEVISSVANLVRNKTLEKVMTNALVNLGAPEFDAEEKAFAREVQKSFSEKMIEADFASYNLEMTEAPLGDFLVPNGDLLNMPPSGSTDVSDVSWVVPTVQMDGANFAIGTPLHSWQLVAQGKSTAAHKGMVHAAKVIAATAQHLFEDSATREAAWEELNRKHGRANYKTALSADAMPPIAAMTTK